jgi:hypothetical protein
MLTDESLVIDVNLHLQELGKDIMASKLVEFLVWPKVVAKHGIMKKIGMTTAQ